MRTIWMRLCCLGWLFTVSLAAQDKSANLPLPTLSESEVLHFQMLVEGNNRFAFDLYQHMKNQPGNLYFSPYSIASGLAMIAIGAKGETANQFQHAFRYSPALLLFIGDLNESLQKPSDSRNSAQVLLANALWIDPSVPILPSFKQTLQRDFRSTLQPIDFVNHLSQSVQKINQWVLQQTNGKIGNMVAAQDINMHTRMILTTAASLKGRWSQPFEKLSKRLPFQISAQRTLLADMIQSTAHYSIWKGEQWDLLVIPYEQSGQGAQLAMAVFLPKKDIALAVLERNLTWDNWLQWKKQIQSQRVALTLPRFRIDKRFDLETSLKALGFTALFHAGANLSGITSEKEIYLNKALHKTLISLDEKGLDMSAATGIKTAPVSDGETSYEFVADRPFVFMIWDQKTDAIVFMGRLSLP